MTKFLRLLEILHTIGKFRLDKLIGEQAKSLKSVPIRLQLFLFFFNLYPENNLPRGQRLKLALEDLGPIFVKFGQLLSTRPDLFPRDIVQELDHLQDNVKPFDNVVFRNIVESSLGAPIDTLFQSFDETPLASASIAQVHGAVLKNGNDVVIKVIRPDIEGTINKDIDLLSFIARLTEKFVEDGKRFRPIEIVQDYRTTILDELDLMREAGNASQLKRNFSGSSKIYIPDIYWEFTRRNVMVMERIYGIPVSDITQLREQNTDLKLLAERGVEIFFTQVFEHNFFHADMHPGNVFVSKSNPGDPSYIAVDIAIVGSLTREDQYYLARNLLAMFRRDYRQVAELHVLSGWVPRDTSISGFESAIRTVCEPIFEKPLKDISFGEALITLFRTARRFNMPVQPQLVLLQKTLLNIEGLGRQLYPELNLWDTAHPYLERWIKKRFHPQTLWRELKHHSPEWFEKFPQVPHLVFDTLKEVKALSEVAPELSKASKSIAEQKSSAKKYKLKSLIAVISAATAAYLGWAEISQLPVMSLVLISIAALVIMLS